jgi:hypothetical protein
MYNDRTQSEKDRLAAAITGDALKKYQCLAKRSDKLWFKKHHRKIGIHQVSVFDSNSSLQ